MDAIQQAGRLRELCQLSAFSEKFYLSNRFSNKVLDAIQDGFLLCDQLPEVGLIYSIYTHSNKSSKLRQFISHCLIYGVRIGFENYENIGEFLQENGDVLADFSKSICFLIWDDH